MLCGKGVLLALLLAASARAQGYERERDVVYGRKADGLALTMDVLRPHGPNGAGVVWVISAGYRSSRDAIQPVLVSELLRRGYAVFAVLHGSQPRYAIPEAAADVDAAVGFIRARARGYGVDPGRLGILGGSAGGHLALLQGVAGKARVRAVAAFFPPTDFLNYGGAGHADLGTGVLSPFKACFGFKERDPETGRLVPVTDELRRRRIARSVSPAALVTPKAAPALLIHGDADTLVPLQQSILMAVALKRAGVPVELVVKRGKGHGWADLKGDLVRVADWFDRRLRS